MVRRDLAASAAAIVVGLSSVPAPGQPVRFKPGELLIVDRDTFGEPPEPNSLRGAVIRVDRETGVQEGLVMNGPFLGPQDGTFTPTGMFYVVDRSTEMGGAVYATNLYTGRRFMLTTASHFRNPRTIMWDDEMNALLVVDPMSNPGGYSNSSGAVIAVDHITGQQRVLVHSALFRFPVGLVKEPEGTFLIIDEEAEEPRNGQHWPTGSIFRWDPITGDVVEVSTRGMLERPRHGAISPVDSMLYVADWSYDPADPRRPPHRSQTGTIFRIDRVTGAQEIVSTGGYLIEPVTVEFDLDGTLIVADKGFNNNGPDGRIVRVDPLTGEQSIITGIEGQFPENLVHQPHAILLVPDDYPPLILAVGPLLPGRDTLLEVDGVAPHEQAMVARSLAGEGSTYISRYNVTIDLATPLELVQGTADARGHVEVRTRVRMSTPAGRRVWFQAVGVSDDNEIVKSRVVETHVQRR